MADRPVEIKSLTLSIEGGDRARGERLARAVGERLTQRLAAHERAGQVGALRVRVQVADGDSVSAIANRVAAAIVKVIR